jgi:superfamily I DNA and/or RNA helicase
LLKKLFIGIEYGIWIIGVGRAEIQLELGLRIRMLGEDDNLTDMVAPLPPSEGGFISSVASYFRDFLDTDFKRTRTPKRAITSKDRLGHLTGINLSKYPDLERELWTLLGDNFDKDLEIKLSIRRGRYKSRLKKSLVEVIEKHISFMGDGDLEKIVSDTKATVRELRDNHLNDVEKYSSIVLNHLKSSVLRIAVAPLIDQLENYYENESNDSYEGIYNLEEELGECLVSGIEEQLGSSLATVIVANDFTVFDNLIEDILALDNVKRKYVLYFESFSTSDFYQDLHELRGTTKLKENFQIYIYACALRFNKTSYPLYYFPIEISFSNAIFNITLYPHLFINKRALDFGSQEVSREIGRSIIIPIEDRIIYLTEGDSFVKSMQSRLDEWSASLALKASIDLSNPSRQTAQRSQIQFDNSLHFAAFDQADESLLNDYEELLTRMDENNEAAVDFRELIDSFMNKNPISYEAIVDEEWSNKTIENRLVYESPVPLNEEQRKIISALSKDDCRFVAVEGPPGTGKSHTITACVFDYILRGKNVLVLSDKREALDVVENKISQSLKKVRVDENIQDPILRLGKHGNTYSKILASKTIVSMKASYEIGKQKEKALNKELEKKEKELKTNISNLVDAGKHIDIKEIATLQRQEKLIENYLHEPDEVLADDNFIDGVIAAIKISDFVGTDDVKQILDSEIIGKDMEALSKLLAINRRIQSCGINEKSSNEARFFNEFTCNHLNRLRVYIDEYEDIRWPIIGFLFVKKKAREIDRKFSSELKSGSTIDLHKKLSLLKLAEIEFSCFIGTLEKYGLSEVEINVSLFQYLRHISIPLEQIESINKAVQTLETALVEDEDEDLVEIGVDTSRLISWAANSDSSSREILEKIYLCAKDAKEQISKIRKIPQFDYTRDLSELEVLQTQKLANIMDGRVVEFSNTQKNLSAQIKDIIRKKQKFPKKSFVQLKTAFPCMIAGIRDYAEYVPLEKGIFDLVIIDEGSQVSIAQALPAFIRGKKMLVLGDKNQFSNVKTSNASKQQNAAYLNQIIDSFKKEHGLDVQTLNQVKLFNIKTSVLEFVERISNIRVMLRKHFRGYPELIGFSSKTFYGDSLQAVKIRGKPIDEVIKFTEVKNEGSISLARNINEAEVDKIIEELRTIASQAEILSVCIITPHTEQQAYILKRINTLEDGVELTDKLELRVFTFDTCQGEERDVVIMSMVATPDKDRLNYIFSKDIKDADDVEDVLRLQRLNVGFSRAKECLHIFHSKPLSDFNGSIGSALRHYQHVINQARRAPDVSETDPHSPMEAKVLNWIRQSPYVDELGEKIEIDAQFELGEYLKQLDKTYRHPAYRVDFLIKIKTKKGIAQIIIEYDGFKEHFTNLDEVDVNNYEDYMKLEDIERQKTLEGYGYYFLRINRFNVGRDPIQTFDVRLRDLAKRFELDADTPKLIEEHKKESQELKNGDRKRCPKCGKIKPKSDFKDSSLKNGYGRNCMECKGKPNKRRAKRKSSSADYIKRNYELLSTGKGESNGGKILSMINSAIKEGRRIEFSYRARNANKSEIRRIGPIELVNMAHRHGSGSTQCVLGYCEKRNANRNFALKRMSNLRII